MWQPQEANTHSLDLYNHVQTQGLNPSQLDSENSVATTTRYHLFRRGFCNMELTGRHVDFFGRQKLHEMRYFYLVTMLSPCLHILWFLYNRHCDEWHEYNNDRDMINRTACPVVRTNQPSNKCVITDNDAYCKELEL